MKFLSRGLATLLSAAIVLAVTLWTLGATLANPQYLTQAAEQTRLYDQLAPAFPGLDANLIADQVEPALSSVVNFLTKGGPAPTADFGAGPVTLVAPDAPGVAAVQALPLIAQAAPLAVLILVVIILVVMHRHRLATFQRAAFMSALGLAVTAALVWFGPGIALSIMTPPDIQPVRAAITPFLTVILQGVATRLLIAAGVLAGAGILIGLAHGAARFKSRFMPRRPASEPEPESTIPRLRRP
jgi:hypothetical protein